MQKKAFIQIDAGLIKYNLCNLKQLVFEVTDACNLKCKYCAFSDLYTGYDTRKNNFLDLNAAKTIIDYLAEFWKKHMSDLFPRRLNIGFYGGEPLLNFNFIQEIITYVEKKQIAGRNLSYSMTTNGTFLDKYIDYLVEKDFALLISLDGDRKGQSLRKYHNGKESFDDVYANTKMIQERYPSYFQTRVSFNAVLHSMNDIPSLYKFFKTHFGKIPRISPLTDTGINKEYLDVYEDLCSDYNESFYKLTDADRVELETSNLFSSPRTSSLYKSYEQLSGNVFYDFHELLIDSGEHGWLPTGTCTPFSKKMFITVNKKILQCERIDHCHLLGRIEDKQVELNLDKIVTYYNQAIYKYIHQCTSCRINQRCVKCIYRIDDFETSTSCDSYSKGKFPEINLKLLKENPRLLTEIYNSKTVR